MSGLSDYPILSMDEIGPLISYGGMTLRGDYTPLIPRLRKSNLEKELIVRAARIKGRTGIKAVDATGGLGEDALLLAAAGIDVRIFERNENIFRLLDDAIRKGREIEELQVACNRMVPFHLDSILALGNLDYRPDIILLDPMFPEKSKTGLTKKKLQLIQSIASPGSDEEELLKAALDAKPGKIIIKRPLKGPYLGGIKPNHSYMGRTVRIDCIVL